MKQFQHKFLRLKFLLVVTESQIEHTKAFFSVKKTFSVCLWSRISLEKFLEEIDDAAEEKGAAETLGA